MSLSSSCLPVMESGAFSFPQLQNKKTFITLASTDSGRFWLSCPIFLIKEESWYLLEFQAMKTALLETLVPKCKLTGSARRCVLPRTPSATCALEPAGWGKPSWSRERRDTPTSAGTGTDTPPAGPLGASEAQIRWNTCQDSAHVPVMHQTLFRPT